MATINKIVNHAISGLVGLLIGLLIWVAFTTAPPASAQEPETAYPISPATSCLLYGKFCEPDGICFKCTVI